jgi:hypothetical protein
LDEEIFERVLFHCRWEGDLLWEKMNYGKWEELRLLLRDQAIRSPHIADTLPTPTLS